MAASVLPTLFGILFALTLLGAALAVCITSDWLERRTNLKNLRKRMLLEPDVPDDQFAVSFAGPDLMDVLEMRRMLGGMIGVEPIKVRADWRFREDRCLKNMDLLIFHMFASRYAPDRLRGQAFAFPTAQVSTVQELFNEALRLKRNG